LNAIENNPTNPIVATTNNQGIATHNASACRKRHITQELGLNLIYLIGRAGWRVA
jgi:hypothetical protein